MRFEELFERATGAAPYAYQIEFARSPSLPDILEAATGSGKTACVVLGWLWRRMHGTAAQRAEAGARLVFCLPMRTLVEQTERAVATWRDRLGLSSEQLGVYTLMGGAIDDDWEGRPEQNAILIGTQDQLLSRALMRGYAMSRYMWPVHFAWLNNDCTWVMDEVQLMGCGASTAAQLQAFREQLHVAGSVKTIWMTATLAEGRLQTVDVLRTLKRQPFEPREAALVKRFRAVKQLRRCRSAIGKKATLAPLAREIAAAHVPGSLTLVVVNRVARAQELYALLKNEAGVDRVLLVHSRFRPADRRAIQTAALSGSYQGVLVATQAIEAGVDISAKTLFTELAPWASLVQRFGRLNRAGEHSESSAFWIDLDAADQELCLPYEPEPLMAARVRLEQLRGVSPAELAELGMGREEPALPVLRRKDLLELFDTEPDLAGRDLDVSRYVRATDDRDVQVAWRDVGASGPASDAPELQRDELCSVPIQELKKLSSANKVWRFDSLRRRWIEVDRLVPGLTVVVDRSVGGYSSELGFTRDKAHVPSACVVLGAPPPDFDEADRLTYGAQYVALTVHAEDTAGEMRAMLEVLGALSDPFVTRDLLIESGRWHDAGKTHAVFQAMLTAELPADDLRRAGGPWAKSDYVHSGAISRRYFRHELVSALTWMAAGKSDLGAFIIAAHHGKIRMSLRARPGEEPPHDRARRFAHGVHDGDELPPIDLGSGVRVPAQTLSLECMELGGGGSTRSWGDRTMQLLEQLGPFRLAYVEALVRVADWRATRKRKHMEETRD